MEKLTKEQRQAKAKYKLNLRKLEIWNEVQAVFDLVKENPTYKDKLLDTIRQHVNGKEMGQFVLTVAATDRKVYKAIQAILEESKS